MLCLLIPPWASRFVTIPVAEPMNPGMFLSADTNGFVPNDHVSAEGMHCAPSGTSGSYAPGMFFSTRLTKGFRVDRRSTVKLSPTSRSRLRMHTGAPDVDAAAAAEDDVEAAAVGVVESRGSKGKTWSGEASGIKARPCDNPGRAVSATPIIENKVTFMTVCRGFLRAGLL